MRNFLFVITTLLMVLFQNCSKEISVEDISYAGPIGGLDSTPSDEDEVVSVQPVQDIPAVVTPGGGGTTTPTAEPPSYEQLKLNCDNAAKMGKLKKQVLTASFPNPKKTCDWGLNGNYNQENDSIRARREQFQTLNLSMGAKVCSLNMKSVTEDKFFYDDNIFLTLNGYVLASTSNFSQHLISNNGFYQYNWTRLRNKDAQNHDYNTTLEKQYCAGAALGSSCSFPETETYGAVKLQFKDEVFQKILGMTNASQVKLGVITTGDDNPDTDCQHVDINFNVEVSYYE